MSRVGNVASPTEGIPRDEDCREPSVHVGCTRSWEHQSRRQTTFWVCFLQALPLPLTTSTSSLRRLSKLTLSVLRLRLIPKPREGGIE